MKEFDPEYGWVEQGSPVAIEAIAAHKVFHFSRRGAPLHINNGNNGLATAHEMTTAPIDSVIQSQDTDRMLPSQSQAIGHAESDALHAVSDSIGEVFSALAPAAGVTPVIEDIKGTLLHLSELLAKKKATQAMLQQLEIQISTSWGALEKKTKAAQAQEKMNLSHQIIRLELMNELAAKLSAGKMDKANRS